MINNNIRRIYRYSIDLKRQIQWASLFAALNKFFDIMPEILIGVAVDLVVRQKNSLLANWGILDPYAQISFLGVLTFLIWALESLFQYLYAVGWKNISQHLQHRFRQDAFSRVIRSDLAWMSKQKTGDILATLNDDINQIERFVDRGIVEIIHITVSTVLVGAVFFYVAPILEIGTILPIPLILGGVWLFQKLISSRYLLVRNSAGLLAAQIESSMIGHLIIRAFGAETFQQNLVSKASEAYLKANSKAIRISSSFIPLIRIAILCGFLITLVGGAFLTLNGSIEVGSYSVLIFLTQRFLWPFTNLGEMIDTFSRSMASATRVFKLLDTQNERLTSGDLKVQKPLTSLITFENVSFAYDRGIEVFKNFSLQIPIGKMTAFVGATGSGKSSLIKLLLRLYSPQSGQIFVGGNPIQEYNLEDYRKLYSFVAQEATLFPGTVAENIAFGQNEIDFDRVYESAKMAEADGFIAKLPNGYHSVIGERGSNLSGGQQQRIAIARAIYRESPILIFDEATSAVDNETEAAIQRSLQKVSQDRTTLVIAHRLSTIRHADEIHVLDQGRIVESGTHEALLEKSGAYARLWALQTGGKL